jgi:acetyl esterase
MRTVLHRVKLAGRPALHTLPVGTARQAYEAAAEILDLPRAPLGRVEELGVPTTGHHRCRARLYATDRARRPVLLYLHGGGFTIGSLETHDSLCRQLARRSGAAVLALDYRLAPEHRFPVAVDDAWAALQWLADEAGTLGLDADRLAVGGDSAGGTLAAVCALLARDAGLPLRQQLLITPGTASHGDWPSRRRYAEGFLLDEVAIEWFFRHYIAGDERRDWRFAPLEADSLDDLAPATFALAECDPLCDEGLAYADRLRMAGVPVALELWRGVTHDFIKMGRVLPQAAEAQRALAATLAAAFDLPPTEDTPT